MSTCTPRFPSTDITPSGRRRSNSSSSGTSISPNHASPILSYSTRISRSYLALASVSEYISRPPSPTSAAVDIKRVTQLRRKFRLAVDATCRDPSSGKWAHVSEMAKLGSTRGRWQGICSGSSAPSSLSKAHEQINQGIAVDSADPYPRPPTAIFDLRGIRERVENWKADVSSAPLPQADERESELNQRIHVRDAEQPSPLNFPIVKHRKSDVAKAMKRKNNLSRQDHSTSRYIHGVADPIVSEGVNRDTEDVLMSPSEPRGLNAVSTPHSHAEALDEDPGSKTAARRRSPVLAADIGQVSELFLPPSFPPYLRTSTPPPCTTQSAHLRLAKPPEIPRTEDLRLSHSLPSPQPFPLSQSNLGHEFQPNGSPSSSRRKRPLQETPSPSDSPNRLSKRRLQLSSPEKHPLSPKSPFGEPHADVRRCVRSVFPALSPPVPVPVIDLRQLVSSQRSRAQSRNSLHGITPVTPGTENKGKGRAMTTDISPSQQIFPSPLASRPLARVSSHSPMRSLSQTNFTRGTDVLAPTPASTQPPLENDPPCEDNAPVALSRGSNPTTQPEVHSIVT